MKIDKLAEQLFVTAVQSHRNNRINKFIPGIKNIPATKFVYFCVGTEARDIVENNNLK